MAPSLEVDRLSVSFDTDEGPLRVLDELSFTLPVPLSATTTCASTPWPTSLKP